MVAGSGLQVPGCRFRVAGSGFRQPRGGVPSVPRNPEPATRNPEPGTALSCGRAPPPYIQRQPPPKMRGTFFVTSATPTGAQGLTAKKVVPGVRFRVQVTARRRPLRAPQPGTRNPKPGTWNRPLLQARTPPYIQRLCPPEMCGTFFVTSAAPTGTQGLTAKKVVPGARFRVPVTARRHPLRAPQPGTRNRSLLWARTPSVHTTTLPPRNARHFLCNKRRAHGDSRTYVEEKRGRRKGS